MVKTPHNIYIHVPFCMSKCNYCAFFSHACANPDWEKFCTQICNEIEYWGQKIPDTDVPTIFFGGGTPSLMPTWCIDKIIQTIDKNFQIDKYAEITLESNPKTIDKQKLNDIKKIGINRLSVGVQSFDDKKLEFLGRKHTANDAIELIHNAQDIGLRVSGDFIYGAPNETVDDVINTCKQINNIGLTHCSMYELTIEENTPFGRMNLSMPDNETMAQMYNAIYDNLNLNRYEVSNYATNGDECKHNTNIWDGGAYIGIGQGAAGRPYINNTWYEQMGNYSLFEPMTDSERAIEMIITGMRTIPGCKRTPEIDKIINKKWVDEHDELVKITDDRICTTRSGMLILDDILVNITG